MQSYSLETFNFGQHKRLKVRKHANFCLKLTIFEEFVLFGIKRYEQFFNTNDTKHGQIFRKKLGTISEMYSFLTITRHLMRKSRFCEVFAVFQKFATVVPINLKMV